jgi:hypothetical protein
MRVESLSEGEAYICSSFELVQGLVDATPDERRFWETFKGAPNDN